MTTADILLAAQNEKLRENWHGVLHQYSVDNLHDLRINLRRIRVLLVFFKDFWPAHVVKTTEKKIKKLCQMLGPLRDRQEWLAFLESVPNGHVMTPAQLKRADGTIQRQAQRILTGQLAKEVLQNLAALLGVGRGPKGRKRLPKEVEKIDENLRRLAKNRLDKILNKAEKWSAVDADTPMPKVHALRRQVRRARYLMEMLALILPQAAGSWARLFRKMALALGEWHDMTVMQERLAKLDNEAKTAVFMKEAGRRLREAQKAHQRHWREWLKARVG